MHIVIIDIAEQSEVIQILQQSIEWLQKSYPDHIFKLSDYQLKSYRKECDYDFSHLPKLEGVDILFIHTKTLLREGGQFKTKDWWLNFFKGIDYNHNAELHFYSGNINEYEMWLSNNMTKSDLVDFSKLADLRTIDVFDLIYPSKFRNFEHWLEIKFKNCEVKLP